MNALSTLMIWWMFFSMASVILAIMKHRNEVLWFTASMFFGPLALIAILFMPTLKPKIKN